MADKIVCDVCGTDLITINQFFVSNSQDEIIINLCEICKEKVLEEIK